MKPMPRVGPPKLLYLLVTIVCDEDCVPDIETALDSCLDKLPGVQSVRFGTEVRPLDADEEHE